MYPPTSLVHELLNVQQWHRQDAEEGTDSIWAKANQIYLSRSKLPLQAKAEDQK